MTRSLSILCSFAAYFSVCSAQVLRPLGTSVQNSDITTVPLRIEDLFNNRAFGLYPGDANFDGSQNAYPAQYHPGSNLIYDGYQYELAPYQSIGNDNLISQGQQIPVTQGKYFSFQMLVAAESSTATGSVTAYYADGSTSTGGIQASPWWLWAYPSGGDIVMPFYYTNYSMNYNKTNIFQAVNWLDSSKELVSLRLPISDDSNRLHIFAISLRPVVPSTKGLSGLQLEVQYARSTKKWIEGTNNTQIFEVTVSNVGQHGWVSANDSVVVSIESEGVLCVEPGVIKRLRPGDQVVVEVGVVNKPGVVSGTTGNASAHLHSSKVDIEHNFEASFGIGSYEPTYESIYSHESPSWYSNAKFGIFIHWGLYSIPAWGNSGANETYAEWYWWDLNQGPDTSDQTYEFHLQHYGTNFTYDDFIPQFSAEAFDPKEWVDLFSDAGAKYFVLTTKHHDGYALFDMDSTITKRNSVALSPHRNIVQELFDAASMYQPHLHRATYYSLPEWFNPDYLPYGFGRWPGGNATNPFTNVTLPYTGYVTHDDYVQDLVLPQMLTLASMGSELMWCDIGGPNMTAEFAASWFNNATVQGRQVTMNNRCGLPGDFDTPEYTTFAATQQRKWESNSGMDPYSYGFNRATPLNEYMNASTIITTLVDIISKNGNFLLDIGPMGNGTILDVEAQNLREAGSWINSHGEAIFNTTYWFVASEEGSDVRFTTKMDAFYVFVMNQVNDTLTLTSPIPWLEGDQVTVVGGRMNGTVVPSNTIILGNQTAVQFHISEEVRTADQWTWVFKITYDL